MAGPPSATSSGRRTSTGPGHSSTTTTSTSYTVPGTFGHGSALAGQDFQSIADKLRSSDTGKQLPLSLSLSSASV